LVMIISITALAVDLAGSVVDSEVDSEQDSEVVRASVAEPALEVVRDLEAEQVPGSEAAPDSEVEPQPDPIAPAPWVQAVHSIAVDSAVALVSAAEQQCAAVADSAAVVAADSVAVADSMAAAVVDSTVVAAVADMEAVDTDNRHSSSRRRPGGLPIVNFAFAIR